MASGGQDFGDMVVARVKTSRFEDVRNFPVSEMCAMGLPPVCSGLVVKKKQVRKANLRAFLEKYFRRASMNTEELDDFATVIEASQDPGGDAVWSAIEFKDSSNAADLMLMATQETSDELYTIMLVQHDRFSLNTGPGGGEIKPSIRNLLKDWVIYHMIRGARSEKMASDLFARGQIPDQSIPVTLQCPDAASPQEIFFRVDADYLTSWTALLDSTPQMNLASALVCMKDEIMHYMTTQGSMQLGPTLSGPTQTGEAIFKDKKSTENHLKRWANKNWGNSFRKCYTDETPVPVYKIASSLAHSENRLGKDGCLAKSLQHCAPFYKGLEDEVKADREKHVTAGTVFRGVEYDFPNFTEYYSEGTVLAMYEPKSWSWDEFVARQFAGDSGTVYVLNLIQGYDLQDASDFDEGEVLLCLGAKFIVSRRDVICDGPNVVHLQQIV
jgi:hypothetical protein